MLFEHLMRFRYFGRDAEVQARDGLPPVLNTLSGGKVVKAPKVPAE